MVIEQWREGLYDGERVAGALFGFPVLALPLENRSERIQKVRHVG
jgi:hypothetical protein